VFRRELLLVLWTVEFDDEFLREADEVDDVGADGDLAAELETAQLAGAKEAPEALFRFSHLIAQASSEVALVFVAVHAR